MRPPAMERWYTALWDPGGGIILSVDGGFSGEADRAMSVMRLSGLFPRETSQAGMPAHLATAARLNTPAALPRGSTPPLLCRGGVDWESAGNLHMFFLRSGKMLRNRAAEIKGDD